MLSKRKCKDCDTRTLIWQKPLPKTSNSNILPYIKLYFFFHASNFYFNDYICICSHLPRTMANIYKKRRLAKLRRGLSRWQDFTRGSSLAYIKNVELDFQKREAEYLHNGKLVVIKLR